MRPVKVPEFIPYYNKEATVYNLNKTEALLYGLIRFVLKREGKRFYFTDDQIALILSSTRKTVNNAMQTLKRRRLVETKTSVRMNGGKFREVMKYFICGYTWREIYELEGKEVPDLHNVD